MSTVPSGTFATQLSALDHDEFCSFVADVWAASGWETSVEGSVVTARKADRTERLLIVSSSRLGRFFSSSSPDRAVDGVVSPRIEDADWSASGAPEAPVVDADELRHRLLYGLDDAGARLCREYLDIELRGGEYAEQGGRRRLVSVALASLAVVLVASGLAVVLGLVPVLDGGQTVEASSETTLEGGYDAEVTPATEEASFGRPDGIPRGAVAYVTTVNGSETQQNSSIRALSAETGELVWETRLPDTGRSLDTDSLNPVSSPIVVDGTVYVEALGQTYALDATTGEVKWEAEYGRSGISFQPTVVGGTLYLTSGGSLIAIDVDSGEAAWTRNLPTPVFGSPTVKNGTVYTTSADGSFLAVDAETGEPLVISVGSREIYRANPAVLVDILDSSGRPTGNQSYVVPGSETVEALDSATGEKQWVHEVSQRLTWITVDRTEGRAVRARSGTGVDHPLPNGTVYAATTSSKLVAIDAQTGEQRWTFVDIRSPSLVSPTVANVSRSNESENGTTRQVFVTGGFQTDINGTLRSVRVADGNQSWSNEQLDGSPGRPTVAGDQVYVPLLKGDLHVVDATNGTSLWTHDVSGTSYVSTPTVVENPFNGDSVDSSVRLGTVGHHDSLYPGGNSHETNGSIEVVDHDESAMVAPGEQGTLSLTLVNSGANNSTARIEVATEWDLSGQLAETTATLEPNAGGVYRLQFETPAEVGEYSYEVTVGDQQVSGSITVVESPTHEVVSVDVVEEVYRGDRTDVLVTVKNVDNVTATTPIALAFDGEIVDRSARTVPGNTNATVTVSFEVDDELPPGTHGFAVATQDDVSTGTLEVRSLEDLETARSIVRQLLGIVLLVLGLTVGWWLLGDSGRLPFGREDHEELGTLPDPEDSSED